MVWTEVRTLILGIWNDKADVKALRIRIVGSGQDDGIPHTGCYCEVCNRARIHAEYRRLGPSMAVIDEEEGSCYLFDASPDFKYQLDMIHEEMRNTERKGKLPVSGILLTHAHLGHCAGLWHLGKESVDEKELPVICTPKMRQFLCSNYPFSLLVQRGNIRIEERCPDIKFKLNRLECASIQVPHRNEIGDTVGYVIESKKRVMYLPDIDRWTTAILEEFRGSDIAFVDGTFYSENEICRFEEVHHPPIRETIELLEGVKGEIYFTHINHTNPINRNAKERRHIERKGYKIAYDGLTLEI